MDSLETLSTKAMGESSDQEVQYFEGNTALLLGFSFAFCAPIYVYDYLLCTNFIILYFVQLLLFRILQFECNNV